MAVLDGQEVISALAQSIRAAFTTTEFVKLYKDTPVQNMQKPCVFLHSVDTEHQPRMGNSAMWHYIVDVRCHPKDNATDIHTWARGIAVRMLDAINKITVSGQQVKARSVSWKVEHSALHVIASYSFKVVKAPLSATLMDKLYINGVHTQSPEIVDSGEYFEGTLLDIDTGTIQLGDIVIDGQRVDMSLLARNTIIWDSVENGDTLVVLKSGDKYLVIDALNKDRLKPSIDGGIF